MRKIVSTLVICSLFFGLTSCNLFGHSKTSAPAPTVSEVPVSIPSNPSRIEMEKIGEFYFSEVKRIALEQTEKKTIVFIMEKL